MLKNYIKIAFKVMLRQKFFTAVSLFGISFTIMIFSVTAGLMQLTFGDNKPAVNRTSTLYFGGVRLSANPNQPSYSPPYKELWQEVSRVKNVRLVTKYELTRLNSYKNGKVSTFPLAATDAQFWKAYEFKFLEGRPFTAKEVEQSQAYAVISASASKYYFGTGSALGKYIGNEPKLRIIGVVKDPEVIYGPGPESAAIWVPLTYFGKYERAEAIILTNTAASIPQVKKDLRKMAEKFRLHPGDQVYMNAWTIYEELDFKELILFAGPFLFFILLMPTLNLVGLNINRITERSSEIGIRKAFGASSGSLVTQIIVENILLTLIGGIIGFLLIVACSGTIMKVVYFDNPNMVLASGEKLVNWSIIGYSLAGILLFGFVSGIVPAWRMSRLHPVNALKRTNL